MKRDVLSIEQALLQGKALPYAMIRSLSAVYLGKMPADLSLQELIEARFFDAQQEIRIFWREDTLCAAKLQQEEGDHAYCQTYQIQNPQFGKTVTVSYELEADEDGQTYVAACRLIDWKEGADHA